MKGTRGHSIKTQVLFKPHVAFRSYTKRKRRLRLQSQAGVHHLWEVEPGWVTVQVGGRSLGVGPVRHRGSRVYPDVCETPLAVISVSRRTHPTWLRSDFHHFHGYSRSRSSYLKRAQQETLAASAPHPSDYLKEATAV